MTLLHSAAVKQHLSRSDLASCFVMHHSMDRRRHRWLNTQSCKPTVTSGLSMHGRDAPQSRYQLTSA